MSTTGRIPSGSPITPTELTTRMRREHPRLLEGLIGDGGAGLVGGMMGAE